MARIAIAINNLSIRINILRSCFDFVTFPQWQLMIARTQVQNVKHPSLPKGIENLFQ
jgi:hypothetical protein